MRSTIRLSSFFIISYLILTFVISSLGAGENEYVELGTIDWHRDYGTALAESKKTGKPVLILFQEVPGCSTCKNYGLQVLSHPLLAEAAEELFVPLAIFNNRQGDDAEVLRLFREPSWNNPVVRIVDSSNRELTRRLAGDYSPGGFSGAMIQALRYVGKPVPDFLNLVHEELSSIARLEKALFAMYCFWQGEIELGGIKGVVATRSGFMDGREVVEVEYDASRLTYSRLLSEAAARKCTNKVYPLDSKQRAEAVKRLGKDRIADLSGFRPDKSIKYYLSHTIYRFLPLTDYQQVLVNRAVYRDEDPSRYLSKRQRLMLKVIADYPDRTWRCLVDTASFRADWGELIEKTGIL